MRTPMAKIEAPTIKTERWVLRRRQEKDIPQMLDLFNNDEVRHYLGGYPPRDDHSMLRMVRGRKQTDWVVALADTDEYIGECMLCKVVDGYLGEIGYFFRRKNWGFGYATEAVEAIIRYSANTLNLKRMCATVDDRNMRSKKLIEKLGFELVAILPESDFGGRVADVAYFSRKL